MKETIALASCMAILLLYDLYSLSNYPWTGHYNIVLNVGIFWVGFILYDLKGDVMYKEVLQLYKRENQMQRMEEGECTGERLKSSLSAPPRSSSPPPEHTWEVI